MKKTKMVIPVVIVLVLSGFFAVANNYHWFGWHTDTGKSILPDAKDEMRKLYSLYNKQDSSFNIKGIIRLFDRENKNVLKEETPFLYSKQGRQFSSQLGYLQTFLIDSLLIQLDTLNKYIIVSKADDQLGNAPAVAETGLPFEKFMQDTSLFKIEAIVSDSDKQRMLKIKSDLNPEIKALSIFYDPLTYTIKRVETEWWKDGGMYDSKNDGDKTWLTIIDYAYPARVDLSATEKVNKIIVRNDERISPAPAYKDYEIRVTF